MPLKKEWSDLERSKIDQLYDSILDAEDQNPTISFGCGKRLSLEELRKYVLDGVKPLFRCSKNPLLNIAEHITKSDVESICKKLDRMPKVNTNTHVEFIQVMRNPAVRFWDSNMKNGKMYPPRMIVDLSNQNIKPYESVMVSTGYVIRVPQAAHDCKIENNKIVKDETSIVKQPNFVVIPIVTSQTADIIPSIYARDSNDSGIITINFTLISGNVEKLQVVFNAYTVDRLMSGVQLMNPEPSVSLFKPKDGISGRFVKNPKVKIHFDKLEFDKASKTFSFPTYNPLVTPVVTYKNQKVVINSENALFLCSRRREWNNPDLITLGGLIVGETNFVPPKTVRVCEQLKNSHCMVMLKNRTVLLSSQPEEFDAVNLNLLNGAFSNLPNFKDLFNNYTRIIRNSHMLAVGAARCRSMSKELNVSAEKLLKIFDYHRGINANTIKNYLELDDRELFGSRVGNTSALSVAMHKAFTILGKYFCKDTNDDGGQTSRDDDNEDKRQEPPAKKHKNE